LIDVAGTRRHPRRHRAPATPLVRTKLAADGTDLRTAQTLLRHANLNTTAIYTQIVDGKRVEAIDRLSLP